MSKATSDAIREREERLHPKPKPKKGKEKTVEKAEPQAPALMEWPNQ